MNLQLFLTLVVISSISTNAWSPNNNYAPGNVTCPSDLKMLRDAVGLSDQETAWLKKRDAKTQPILKEWLGARFAKNDAEKMLLDKIFNSNSTTNSRIPRIGIAASGGGYRAMLCGAGQISGFDSKTRNGTEAGLGGLLESTTYLAGLSGGNWLVGTLAFNNWTSVQSIVDNIYNSSISEPIWEIENSIIAPEGWNLIKNYDIWDNISDDVHKKKSAGFNISLTDVWGLALTRDFFPSLTTDKGHGNWNAMSFSDLAKYDAFENAEMPFTIHVADGRYPGTVVINTNNTLFEFNPFEMGSWDGNVNSFANLTYVGTDITDGKPTTDTCVRGYDSVPFILGTSSSLFNMFLLDMNSTSVPSFLKNFLSDYLTDLSNEFDDIAVWDNNPFYKSGYSFENVTTEISINSQINQNKTLYLGDGGEDGENIPLVPLLQQEREIDVIFALDNSCDTEHCWPAGLSLVSTYERQFGLQRSDLAFPYVPDSQTFVNSGLNKKPTFFGCDAKNMTDLAYIPPLIVYIPNSEYSFKSNTSTFKMSYTDKERINIIQNGFEVVSYNNLTGHDNYDYCISCAIIRRSQERLGLNATDECNQCFSDFCWDGTYSHANASSNDTVGKSSTSSTISFETNTPSSSTSTKKSKNDGSPISTNWLITFIAIMVSTVFG